MSDPFGSYDTSYPPELWEAPAAPPIVGAARVADGEVDGDEAVVVTSDGVEHVGILPASAATSADDTGPEAAASGESEQGARPSSSPRRSPAKRRR